MVTQAMADTPYVDSPGTVVLDMNRLVRATEGPKKLAKLPFSTLSGKLQYAAEMGAQAKKPAISLEMANSSLKDHPDGWNSEGYLIDPKPLRALADLGIYWEPQKRRFRLGTADDPSLQQP